MPMTWITRWVLLDNIQLPFLLLSILAATYLNNPTRKQDKNLDGTHQSRITSHQILMILISGISLGLAIFTKTPAIMFVPLVGYLIYKNNGSLKYLLLWLIPIIIIQPLWPAYALSIGEFDEWKDSIFFQTHREPLPLFDLSGEQNQNSINNLFYSVDPIIMGIGFIALIYAGIQKRSTYFTLDYTFCNLPILYKSCILLLLDCYLPGILYCNI